MRNLLFFVLFGCVLAVAIARPSHFHNEEREEAEYENELEGDDAEEESEDRLDGQETAAEDQDEEPQQSQRVRENRNQGSYHYQNLHSGKNSALEEVDKSSDNTEYQSPRESKKLTGRNENADQSEHNNYFLNPEYNKLRIQKNVLDKGNLADGNNAVGDILFENSEPNQEQPAKVNKNDYKAAESQEQLRYPRRVNIAASQDARDRSENTFYSNRERRALQESNNDTISNSNPAGDPENAPDEDEEAAIKRHVKKLSVEELNKFMSSLSVDKRELLKKIMNSDENTEVDKREITKKTGAAPDENSFLDGVSERPADPGKLQETDSVTTTTTPEVSVVGKETKPHENPSPNMFLPKEAGNETSSIIDHKSEQADISSKSTVPDSSNLAKIVADAQEPSKTESKRDVSADLESIEDDDPEFDENLNAKDLQDLSNESGHYCQGKEIVDNDPQSDGYSNTLKREVHDEDLKNSIKSLEESFPNSNSYDDEDPYSGSDMAPLVRVKRNNMYLAMKKRAAGVLPDARVGFCPYRSETDDEDNDEGNEFDNDGFYERASNLAKNKKETLENSSAQLKSDSKKNQPCLNLKNEKMGLGSDSDGVVTGVEGADENLMLNSGPRNKRTVEESKLGEPAVVNPKNNQNRLARSTPSSDGEANTKSDNNAPLYNENDAFGALSRTYEGELGRYKRIRRVKQPSLVESEVAPSN